MMVAGFKKWRCRVWRLGGITCGFSTVRCRFPLTRRGFLKDTADSDKVLYSLRHTYAAPVLLAYKHTGKANGHQCADVGAALLQVDGNTCGEKVGLVNGKL